MDEQEIELILENLKKLIEKMREELNVISKNKKLIDPEVIAASKMIDVVLTEYYLIIKNKDNIIK